MRSNMPKSIENYRRAQTSMRAMEHLQTDVLEQWESEGGATLCLDASACLATQGFGPSIATVTELVGTANQIEWADQIKERVNREFDRVSTILTAIAAKQAGLDQTDILNLVAILEEKRHGVMANDRAGYFIRDRQELRGQVREMIVKDPRYTKIMAGRAARKHAITENIEGRKTHWPEGAEL